MIRHVFFEGWLVFRDRTAVSLILALALAVPLCLAGITLMAGLWLRPLISLGTEGVVVAVLLHPELDPAERSRWLAEQAERHPEWLLREVRPEELADRLRTWFPYLDELLRDHRGDFLPPMVEIVARDAEGVGVLESSPSVIAVGPRSTVHQLVSRVARELGWILAVLSGVLLASAVALAAVWVHLEIYRQADELTIMRLIGATETAIRGPFLVAVAVPGVLAALLSIAGSLVVVERLSAMTTAIGLPPVAPVTWVFLLQATAACGLPVVGAAATLARHAYRELDG